MLKHTLFVAPALVTRIGGVKTIRRKITVLPTILCGLTQTLVYAQALSATWKSCVSPLKPIRLT